VRLKAEPIRRAPQGMLEKYQGRVWRSLPWLPTVTSYGGSRLIDEFGAAGTTVPVVARVQACVGWKRGVFQNGRLVTPTDRPLLLAETHGRWSMPAC
jgi:hypothetical protein